MDCGCRLLLLDSAGLALLFDAARRCDNGVWAGLTVLVRAIDAVDVKEGWRGRGCSFLEGDAGRS